MLDKFLEKTRRFLSSKYFFVGVIIFLFIESAWIAISAGFPQAFDEDFHFGLIQIYSHHLSPFLNSQPNGADIYGAVYRDPSYLYHYLLGFPYRLIAHYYHSLVTQIMILRFINIAMFISGVLIFKKVLSRMRLSRGLINVIFLLFCLIPIVPQLAGQINYDNLLFPVVSLAILLSVNLIEQIKSHKPKFLTLMSLLIVLCLGSVVKFAFLPIVLAVTIFIGFYLIKNRSNFKTMINSLVKDFKSVNLILKITLTLILLISIILPIQRYGVNIAKYNNPLPNCSKVLTVKQCNSYYVWQSDNARHQAVIDYNIKASKNPFYYLFQWNYWMWYRLFFAISGPKNFNKNYPPTPLPAAITLIGCIVGLYAIIRFSKKLFKENELNQFLLVALLSYVIILIAQGYSTYQYTGYLENMNGRYLIPVILILVALIGEAFTFWFEKREKLKIIIALIVIVMFIQGGGLITYLARSDDTWNWQNQKILKLNQKARNITNKVIIKGRDTYYTKLWFFN